MKPDGLSSGRPEARNDSKRLNAQNWLRRRLLETSPLEFHSGSIAVYTALRLEIPTAFQPVIHVVQAHLAKGALQAAIAEQLKESAVLLLFCDIFDTEQTQRAVELEDCLRASLGPQRPPTILVSHSAEPELQIQNADKELEAFATNCEWRDRWNHHW